MYESSFNLQKRMSESSAHSSNNIDVHQLLVFAVTGNILQNSLGKNQDQNGSANLNCL